MVKFSKWDTADYLKTEEDIKCYLETALADGDSAIITGALGNVARARRLMGKIAQKNKLSRSSLYKSLSKNANPSYDTISKVIHSLGYELTIKKAG